MYSFKRAQCSGMDFTTYFVKPAQPRKSVGSREENMHEKWVSSRAPLWISFLGVLKSDSKAFMPSQTIQLIEPWLQIWFWRRQTFKSFPREDVSSSRSVATTPVLNTQKLLTQAACGLGSQIIRKAGHYRALGSLFPFTSPWGSLCTLFSLSLSKSRGSVRSIHKSQSQFLGRCILAICHPV